jgi:hypothetical protein
VASLDFLSGLTSPIKVSIFSKVWTMDSGGPLSGLLLAGETCGETAWSTSLWFDVVRLIAEGNRFSSTFGISVGPALSGTTKVGDESNLLNLGAEMLFFVRPIFGEQRLFWKVTERI